MSRTSDYREENPPCDGAFKKRVKFTDRFEYEILKRNNPCAVDDQFKKWKAKGKNNRRILGSETWEHDEVELRWCLRFGSLQSLHDFIKSIEEEVILSINKDYPGYMFLEIYDDYRE